MLFAFVGRKLNPWGHVHRGAVRRRINPVEDAEREAPEPVRFSRGVGFVFALIATVVYAAGWTTPGVVANGFALAAALLNAVFGYCVGCRMYPLISRFAPARWSTSATR